MNKKQIIAELRKILKKTDINSDGLIRRKKSSKHNDEIEVLLENLSVLVSYLEFTSEASRRELFDVRTLLED